MNRRIHCEAFMVQRRFTKDYAAWLLLGVTAFTMLPCPRGAIGMGESDNDEAAYTRTINERAQTIVDSLGVTDGAKTDRVRDLVAGQYRALRDIHDARDSKLDEVKQSPGGDPVVAEAWTKVTRDQATQKLNESHRRFVARLAVELSPEQVDKVKDGLTYGVVPITYSGYLKLLPNLSDEQKREILANLLEAREYAMDGGSSEEKHAIFGKYKGRINNYLSEQGFDLKAAEKTRSDEQ